MQQCKEYDIQAEHQSLRWAKEMKDPAAYTNRLQGIEIDKQSFQNELQHDDAFWTGTYTLGYDGHGNLALTTSEIAIPGRVHRQDSHAMVDSMAGYAVYTLDQIEKGTMSHDTWDVAREQFHQFRALQNEILTLQDGESLLGFAMNGQTTRDGVGLLHITRHNDTFAYQTRLVGGLSEGAAHDVLDTFVTADARKIALREQTDNPAYMAIRGMILVDLQQGASVKHVVQKVLDHRNEQLIETQIVASCRSREVIHIDENKKTKCVDTEQYIPRIQRDTVAVQGIIYQQESVVVDDQSSTHQEQVQHIDPWGIGLLVENRRAVAAYTDTVQHNDVIVQKQHIHEVQIEAPNPRDSVIEEHVAHAVDTEKIPTQHKSGIRSSVTGVMKEHDRHPQNINHQITIPLTTVVMQEATHQLHAFQEVTVSFALHQVDEVHMMDHVPIVIQKTAIVETQNTIDVGEASVTEVSLAQESVETPIIEQSDMDEKQIYMIDQIQIHNTEEISTILIQQLHAHAYQSTIKKLYWMEQVDANTYMPVEQLETAQDARTTMHNLLHFLQKIVKKYVGEDKIIARNITMITEDTTSMQKTVMEETIRAYMELLAMHTPRARMFAYVN